MKDLIRLEKRLSQSVLGQNEAIEQLARAIRRNKAGLNRQSGPLGSFYLSGSDWSGQDGIGTSSGAGSFWWR